MVKEIEVRYTYACHKCEQPFEGTAPIGQGIACDGFECPNPKCDYWDMGPAAWWRPGAIQWTVIEVVE